MKEFFEMLKNAKTATVVNEPDFKVTAVMLEDDEYLEIIFLDGKFHDCRKTYFGKNLAHDAEIVKIFPEYSEFCD